MSAEAEYFRSMAARIDLTSGEPFGGAAVIVLPDGETVELLMLDASAEPSQFLATVKTRIDMLLIEMEKSASSMRR